MQKRYKIENVYIYLKESQNENIFQELAKLIIDCIYETRIFI